jgi:acyl-CoA thioester hydrolase
VTEPGQTTRVTVEFEDVDSYGIAHHGRFVAYLERARLRYLESHGLPVYPHGCVPVMYALELRFRKPARLMDALDVSVETEAVDDFTVTLRYRVRRAGEVLVRARSVIAFWDPAGDAPAPVPELFRNRMAADQVGRDDEKDV